MKYLKQFLIGSCAFWYLPQFISVHDFTRPSVIHHTNPDEMYYEYTIYHPIRVGLINVLSLMMKEYFNLTVRSRFLITAILHWIGTIIFVRYYDIYRFTDEEWYTYYYRVLFYRMIQWNIIIYNLERLI